MVPGVYAALRSALCVSAAGVLISASQSAAPAPWFEDVAAKAGIRFVHQSGHEQRYLLPEIMVGGAAVFDMDGDGLLDIYFVQGGSLAAPAGKRRGRALYRNLGNWSFRDVTAGSGTDLGGYGFGVAAGDYDNDGRTDLYVTRIGTNVLLRNDGGGRFTDVTAKAGVGASGWSSSAAFVDFDADGDLDLFVVRYLDWLLANDAGCPSALGNALDYCGPSSYPPTTSVLYRNDGNGRFTDVSKASGIASAPGSGLGIVAGDFNGDGRIDVFVANDRRPNHLWMNRGNGRFTEDALAADCAVDADGIAKAGMGVDAADPDGDGDLDLIVVNLQNEADSFYRNEKGSFTDDTAAAGLKTVSRPFTRFGAGFADFDNDGLLDLYEANGMVARGRVRHAAADPYAEPNLLLRGVAPARFAEVTPRGGTPRPLVATSRAAAFGDLDNDGGIDIVVVNMDAAPYVLRNVATPRGHWIIIRVLDEHGRDALGAEVTVSAGSRTIRRDVRAGYSYLSSNDPRIHVGLRQHTEVNRVVVRWPDGSRDSFGPLPADRVVTLRRAAPRKARP